MMCVLGIVYMYMMFWFPFSNYVYMVRENSGFKSPLVVGGIIKWETQNEIMCIYTAREYNILLSSFLWEDTQTFFSFKNKLKYRHTFTHIPNKIKLKTFLFIFTFSISAVYFEALRSIFSTILYKIHLPPPPSSASQHYYDFFYTFRKKK